MNPGGIYPLWAVGTAYLAWKLSSEAKERREKCAEREERWFQQQEKRTEQEILAIFGPEDRTYWPPWAKDEKILSIKNRGLMEDYAAEERSHQAILQAIQEVVGQKRLSHQKAIKGSEKGCEQLTGAVGQSLQNNQ